LRRERCDLLHEGRDQVLLGSLSDVWCPDCIYNPVTTLFTVGNQCPDTDDRVIDVLGEPVAQFGSNLIIGLADMAVGGGETLQVRDSLDVPNDDVVHAIPALATVPSCSSCH